MREETRKRLERTLMLQRLKWVGAGVGVALLIAGGMWWTGRDAALVSEKRVGAVVASVSPLNSTSTMSIEQGLAIEVKLENGRTVPVTVLRTHEPHVGDHIEITERTFQSGRHLYSWK